MSSDEKADEAPMQIEDGAKSKKLGFWNAFGLFIGIIGFAFSIFTYYKSEKIKQISYQINTPTSKIYDRDNATPAIKLIVSDTVPVTENVYLLTGTIWNSGDFPIDKEDLRDSISIELKNCKQILDYKVVRQKDPKHAAFTLAKKGNAALGVDWKYFDPKYGFSFQIIYAGKEDAGFNLNGKVLDIDGFTEYKPSKDSEDFRNKPLMTSISLAPLLIGLFLSLTVLKQNSDNWKKISKADKRLVFLSVAMLIGMVTYASYLIWYASNAPPF